jgi:hypothetical protein
MLKTIAKLTLLTVLGSLFAISQAQIAQKPPTNFCTVGKPGQCINHGCGAGCDYNGGVIPSCTCSGPPISK